MLNTVEEGLEDIRQGKVLIVVDDEDRENEGDFIVSGEKITPEIVNFMITHGRGLLCAPLPRSRCEELCLAPMAEENTSLLGTPFTISADWGCAEWVQREVAEYKLHAIKDISFSCCVGAGFRPVPMPNRSEISPNVIFNSVILFIIKVLYAVNVICFIFMKRALYLTLHY